MLLSIITINYNNLAGLKRTMQSVAEQRGVDLEWIVIDGNSTDGSAELIRDNASLAAFWVSEPDGGIYEAMNKGVDHATGDYLLFLNSGDSLADPDVLRDFSASKPAADLVCGNTVLVDADGWDVGSIVPPDCLTLLFFYNNNLNHQAVFFSRRCFEGRRYDLQYRLCADRDLILRLLLDKYSYAHWHRLVAKYDITGFSSVQKGRMQAESRKCMDALLPETVARDYDTLVKFRDVDLAKWTIDIINSPRWLRNTARLFLKPLHLFANKDKK